MHQDEVRRFRQLQNVSNIVDVENDYAQRRNRPQNLQRFDLRFCRLWGVFTHSIETLGIVQAASECHCSVVLQSVETCFSIRVTL